MAKASHRKAAAKKAPAKSRKAKSAHHEHKLAAPNVPGLSKRPVWQGHLRLSLVSCPVALYNATTRTNDISFHLLNPETGNRIRMIPTDPDAGPVQRSDLVKGYEIEKNRYVVLDDDDLDSVKLETTHTLEIEHFVDASSIDRVFWKDPYLLLPADDMAAEAYGVIRAAMEEEGRIALGRVVMHTRERLMALEARGKGLLAYSLRMRDEVIDVDAAFEGIKETKADRQMIAIAEKIIEQQEAVFKPEEFHDRYEKALRDLIRRKQAGEKITVAEPPPDTGNVVSLMDALKKSLKGGGAKASHGHAANDTGPKKRKKRAS
jgi:DNA end-binding protein Ku